ncbi:MAG TPA: sigma factor-like helix-turn-helix DNA-binding protein [Streptosporangiaceae bacterium]|jgi:RNA polymerase sigma-70 factor (ECF subfamily)
MDDSAELAGHAERPDSLGPAFLVLLQGLPPAERVVFLLRQGFGYGYADIGVVVGEPPAACRQIFARARRHLDASPPRCLASPEDSENATGG